MVDWILRDDKPMCVHYPSGFARLVVDLGRPGIDVVVLAASAPQ